MNTASDEIAFYDECLWLFYVAPLAFKSEYFHADLRFSRYRRCCTAWTVRLKANTRRMPVGSTKLMVAVLTRTITAVNTFTTIQVNTVEMEGSTCQTFPVDISTFHFPTFTLKGNLFVIQFESSTNGHEMFFSRRPSNDFQGGVGGFGKQTKLSRFHLEIFWIKVASCEIN